METTFRIEPMRRMPWQDSEDREPLLTREWLVTNGLGGYASGSVSNAPTRRYHGLLIAALPAPLGRIMMLNHLSEQITLRDGRVIRLGGAEPAEGTLELSGAPHLREFGIENGMPFWRFDVGGDILEKRLLLLHEQNTVHITYRIL